VSILPPSSRERIPAPVGTPEDAVPLCDLRPGERGRLRTVRLAGEAADHVRALGLHEACDLRLCRSAGMCIVQVIGGGGSGCRIALDRELAREVLVTRITHEGRSIGSA
jgi:Fe2+ transport system protein FeoA